MPWYTFGLGGKPFPQPAPEPVPAALTAAASEVRRPESGLMRTPDSWQYEVWDFYDTLGEFNYGVTWKANMMSRVRLRAAKLSKDNDEPEIQDTGLAAELMMKLSGGVGGQSQLMRSLTFQLDLPGEGYLIGEEIDGVETWSVRSMEEVRAVHGKYEVVAERTPNVTWRELNGMKPIRVWRPHPRYYHLADSPARAARSIMRELELVNRHIQAQYLSRLASAGVVIFPEEITFPVREEFAEAADPFMAEWIEIAAEAIKTPGAATAVVPIPMRVPGEYVDKVKHLDFTLKIDEKIIEKRDSAIKRLATKLDLPAEILLGMGDVNHWSAWQLEESALKVHIPPTAEIICDSVTRGYLWPRLKASGEDPSQWVVWYDMSELAQKPDRSGNAKDAYDRMEISGAAYRREVGFDESDKPDPQELLYQGLLSIIHNLPSGASDALSKVTGIDLAPVVPLSPQAPEGSEPAPEESGAPPPDEGPPPTQGEPPPEEQGQQQAAAAARAERMALQARTQHALRQTGIGPPELLHPKLCAGHAFSCPYTHSMVKTPPLVLPGGAGMHLIHLNAFGIVQVDGPAPYLDTADFISTGRARGHAPV